MQDSLSLMAASPQLIALARAAGEAILTIYHADEQGQVQLKGDDSPLTAADLAAHQVLAAGLPGVLAIPLISEEGGLPDYAERASWSNYWLIDPLDGTKEFIHRNGEFTVNIALIEQGVATLGVVHVPVSDTTYVGINPISGAGRRALKYIGGIEAEILHVRPLQPAYETAAAFSAIASHRHGTEALSGLMQHIRAQWPGEVTSLSAGSSLKFCLVAEGKADFYPRLAPTSEWDTAAAQAVLEAAGGAVVRADALEIGEWVPLRYNSGEQLLNPYFYALGDVQFDWLKMLSSVR